MTFAGGGSGGIGFGGGIGSGGLTADIPHEASFGDR